MHVRGLGGTFRVGMALCWTAPAFRWRHGTSRWTPSRWKPAASRVGRCLPPMDVGLKRIRHGRVSMPVPEWNKHTGGRRAVPAARMPVERRSVGASRCETCWDYRWRTAATGYLSEGIKNRLPETVSPGAGGLSGHLGNPLVRWSLV